MSVIKKKMERVLSVGKKWRQNSVCLSFLVARIGRLEDENVTGRDVTIPKRDGTI